MREFEEEEEDEEEEEEEEDEEKEKEEEEEEENVASKVCTGALIGLHSRVRDTYNNCGWYEHALSPGQARRWIHETRLLKLATTAAKLYRALKDSLLLVEKKNSGHNQQHNNNNNKNYKCNNSNNNNDDDENDDDKDDEDNDEDKTRRREDRKVRNIIEIAVTPYRSRSSVADGLARASEREFVR
uniref:Uncharacterized protein n=1 Tax=Vespula pensylvanica TaxID=30213 RepID=A0A834NIV4_VESPE|nr:hypothetical protein H0235_013920 [Vespula pensylvanica]